MHNSAVYSPPLAGGGWPPPVTTVTTTIMQCSPLWVTSSHSCWLQLLLPWVMVITCMRSSLASQPYFSGGRSMPGPLSTYSSQLCSGNSGNLLLLQQFYLQSCSKKCNSVSKNRHSEWWQILVAVHAPLAMSTSSTTLNSLLSKCKAQGIIMCPVLITICAQESLKQYNISYHSECNTQSKYTVQGCRFMQGLSIGCLRWQSPCNRSSRKGGVHECYRQYYVSK